MNRRDADGFTLIEILLSLAIMSMVLTFAFQAYIAIKDAQQRLAGGMDRDRAAGVLLDRLEREFVGAIIVERETGADPLLHPFLFVSQDSMHDEGSDAVRFITQTPTRMPGTQRRGGLLMVTYGLQSQESDIYELVRKEDPLPDQMYKDISLQDGQVVAERLAGFKMRFQSANRDWVDRWDSTGISDFDQLPNAVEITVKLWNKNEYGELTEGNPHMRQIRLPVRPFPLAPDDPNQLLQACETGTSVQECLAKARNAIEFDSEMMKSIEKAIQNITDVCWNSEEPSFLLGEVKTAYEDRGFDSRGECP